MNKQDAYNYGFHNGYDIANENRNSYSLILEESREKFISDMLEHESDVFRQFSPFEFLARDINASRNPDVYWDTYNKGVYDGICKLVGEEVALLITALDKI